MQEGFSVLPLKECEVIQEGDDTAPVTHQLNVTDMQALISAEALTALMNANKIKALERQYELQYLSAQEMLTMLGQEGVAELKQYKFQLECQQLINEDAAEVCNEAVVHAQNKEIERRILTAANIKIANDTCLELENKLTHVDNIHQDGYKTPPQRTTSINDQDFEIFALLQDKRDIVKNLVDADKLQLKMFEQEIEGLESKIEAQCNHNKIQKELHKDLLKRREQKLKCDKEKFSYKICKEYADKQYEIKVRLSNEEMRAKGVRVSLQATCKAAGFNVEDFTWVFVPGGKTFSKEIEEGRALEGITSEADGK